MERKPGQRTTVCAADLNLVQDSILAKKQKAQQEAMELLQNVFKADLKLEEELIEREKHIDEMKQQNKDAKSKLKNIEDVFTGVRL